MLQIIRDMELVWNMPINLLSDLDSKTSSNALTCHKEWREHVLPSLAKASHKDAQLFLEIAQEYETEHIAAAVQCKEAALIMQKETSGSKGKSSQSNGHARHSHCKSEGDHTVVKLKCRCHRKPCTCGAKSNDTSAVSLRTVAEPVFPTKRARSPADTASNIDSESRISHPEHTSHPEPAFDSAEDVLLARDDRLSQFCKDALESFMKHRRCEFFLAPGLKISSFNFEHRLHLRVIIIRIFLDPIENSFFHNVLHFIFRNFL